MERNADDSFKKDMQAIVEGDLDPEHFKIIPELPGYMLVENTTINPGWPLAKSILNQLLYQGLKDCNAKEKQSVQIVMEKAAQHLNTVIKRYSRKPEGKYSQFDNSSEVMHKVISLYHFCMEMYSGEKQFISDRGAQYDFSKLNTTMGHNYNSGRISELRNHYDAFNYWLYEITPKLERSEKKGQYKHQRPWPGYGVSTGLFVTSNNLKDLHTLDRLVSLIFEIGSMSCEFPALSEVYAQGCSFKALDQVDALGVPGFHALQSILINDLVKKRFKHNLTEINKDIALLCFALNWVVSIESCSYSEAFDKVYNQGYMLEYLADFHVLLSDDLSVDYDKSALLIWGFVTALYKIGFKDEHAEFNQYLKLLENYQRLIGRYNRSLVRLRFVESKLGSLAKDIAWFETLGETRNKSEAESQLSELMVEEQKLKKMVVLSQSDIKKIVQFEPEIKCASAAYRNSVFYYLGLVLSHTIENKLVTMKKNRLGLFYQKSGDETYFSNAEDAAGITCSDEARLIYMPEEFEAIDILAKAFKGYSWIVKTNEPPKYLSQRYLAFICYYSNLGARTIAGYASIQDFYQSTKEMEALLTTPEENDLEVLSEDDAGYPAADPFVTEWISELKTKYEPLSECLKETLFCLVQQQCRSAEVNGVFLETIEAIGIDESSVEILHELLNERGKTDIVSQLENDLIEFMVKYEEHLNSTRLETSRVL